MTAPQIEVSTDLYVALKKLMDRDDRTPSDVIWRLVEEHRQPRTDLPARATGWRIDPSEGLHSGGATIPNGLRLRGSYGRNGVVYAEVKRGYIELDEKTFESPSSAAIHAAQLLGAGSHAINGWRWWEFESPKGSGVWHSLNSLRHPWDVQRRRVYAKRA